MLLNITLFSQLCLTYTNMLSDLTLHSWQLASIIYYGSHVNNIYTTKQIYSLQYLWRTIEKAHNFTSKIITTLTNMWECLFTWTNPSNNFDTIIVAFISLIDLNTVKCTDNLLSSISLIYVEVKSILNFSYALAKHWFQDAKFLLNILLTF